jgi:hypothetical protein
MHLRRLKNCLPVMKPAILALTILLAYLSPVRGETNAPRITDVSFTAARDGTVQRYVLELPGDFKAGQAHDLLIVLHGHGSDRWQFV